MFLKLNFTSAKNQYQMWRVVADIVNNTGITNVTTLLARRDAVPYAADLLANFDSTNSEIIRTADSSGVTAHMSANTSTKQFEFTLQFPVYDNTSTKYYAQIFNTDSGASNVYYNVGTALSGGTMSSSQIATTVSDGDATQYYGTQLSLGGVTDGNTTYSHTNAGNTSYCLWAYITNNCFVWYVTNGGAATVGWHNSSTVSAGPWIIGQYTRYDYFNTMANNIYPVMYTVPDRGTSGARSGLRNNDFQSTFTPLFVTNTSTSYCPFRILNTLDCSLNQTSTNWTTYTKQSVPHTVAGVSVGWKAPISTNSVTAAGTSSYQNSITGTINNKFPNTTLTAATFLHYPLGWELMTYGAHGGNLSDKTGIYLFNGDYGFGDEYTISGTTYSIWPMADLSYLSYRIGLSIPKT